MSAVETVAAMDLSARYAGLQYPIAKTPGPWLLVGVTADPRAPGGIHSADIHFDGDDPAFEFARPADWPELPPATIDAYNAPHRRSHRLALRRMTDMKPWYAVMPAAWAAEARMDIVRARRAAPGRNVCLPGAGGYVCEDDYAPACGYAESAFIAAVDLWRARAERRFQHADVNRGAVESCGFAIAIHRDGGVEFWANPYCR